MPTGLTGSITLQQWAQQANDPLVQRVVFSLLEVHSILNDLSFTTVPTMKVNGARFTGNLPTPNWRKLNEATVTTSGTPSPFSESAYIASNTIDIDRILLKDKNAIGDPLALQVDAYLKSLTYDITDKFFNNNHTAGDSDAFVGIRARLDDSVWQTNSACKIDASGVDMTDSGMTAATANKFIRYIDQMLDVIGSPEGDGCVVYMNRDLRRRVAQAIRLLGAGAGFEMTRDAFDRRLITYRNATVRSIGLKADQSTEIITSTEASTGLNGSSTYTSMYAVKYGDDSLNGWQFEPPNAQLIGQRQEEPTHVRFFFEWALGIYQQYTRAISRVYGIKVA